MVVCEMCGKSGPLFRAVVEGSELSVCESCGKFGRVLRRPAVFASKPQSFAPKMPESAEVIVEDFARLIREAREKSNLTQKEFALKLNEKESVVQKLESGSFTPPIDMARKLEKLLKIVLVEDEKEEKVESQKRASGPLTIGDLIKVKK